jgi:hypothetical protein
LTEAKVPESPPAALRMRQVVRGAKVEPGWA